MRKFTYELEGQEKFYEYLVEKGIIPSTDEVSRSYSTDGFMKSILFECKLDLGANYGLGKAKKQFEGYLERLKNNGEYYPRYSAAIELNGTHRIFIYDNITKDKIEEFDWVEIPTKFSNYINDEVIKYYVDSDTILGLADKYYKANPTSNKRDFFDNYIKTENDKFNIFKGDEKDFRHIMDELNDPNSQKVLGAFYTPDQYVKISTEYLRNAIKDVTTEDYVIIDRCAGTGNLLRFLSDEELSHCIVNTYEAKEWIALNQIYQGKVRRIIPHQYNPNGTLLHGGDALAEDFLNNFNYEFSLRDTGKLTIIMLENPPFKDLASGKTKTDLENRIENNKKQIWIKEQAKKKTKLGNSLNDLCSLFIWSAYEYFEPKYYILYSPIKYWKSNHIIDKEFIDGYICNRKYFHNSEAGISLIMWKNENMENKTISLKSDNIESIVVSKVKNIVRKLFQKENTYFARMETGGYTLTPKDSKLMSECNRNHCTNINENNLIIMLPLWVCNYIPFNDYSEIDVLMKTADGGIKYQKDDDFLNDCLIWSLLTNNNKCNNNCKIYTYGFSIFNRKEKHKTILNLWQQIYQRTNTYGLNNVIQEAEKETRIVNGKEAIVWIDAELRDWVDELKKELKQFYIEYIRIKMLEYELVK